MSAKGSESGPEEGGASASSLASAPLPGCELGGLDGRAGEDAGPVLGGDASAGGADAGGGADALLDDGAEAGAASLDAGP